jgi:hypothetical protein
MNRLLIISLLLLQSCASELKSYRKVTTYTEVGVKCAQEYYYSLRYGKCMVLPSNYSPSGVSIETIHSFKPSLDRVISLNKRVSHKTKGITKTKPKIDCKVILDNINKCSL